MRYFYDERYKGMENEYGWFIEYVGKYKKLDDELKYVVSCLISELFTHYKNTETSAVEVRKELEKLYKAQDKYIKALDRIHLMPDVEQAYFEDHGTNLVEDSMKIKEKREVRLTMIKKKKSFIYPIADWVKKWKEGKTDGNTKPVAKVVDVEPEHRIKGLHNKDKLPRVVMLYLIELWFYLYDEKPTMTLDPIPSPPLYKGKFKDFAEPIWKHFYEVIMKYNLHSRTNYSFPETYNKWSETKYSYDEKYGRWTETKDKEGRNRRYEKLIPRYVEEFKQMPEDAKK
jgi:hypothetical protein